MHLRHPQKTSDDEMVTEFLSNPHLAENIKSAALLLIESIDKNLFSKDVMATDKELIKIVIDNFKDRDPVYEIRLYKVQRLMYMILKSFQESGIISFNNPVSTEDKIKEKASRIWADYQSKKK